MKYLLDTSVLSDFARGEQAVMALLAVSVVTEMEVEYGLARNPNPGSLRNLRCDTEESLSRKTLLNGMCFDELQA